MIRDVEGDGILILFALKKTQNIDSSSRACRARLSAGMTGHDIEVKVTEKL